MVEFERSFLTNKEGVSMADQKSPLKRVLVFASGSKDGGGSGFENLVVKSRAQNLGFQVIGVVTNHHHGGVWQRALKLKVPNQHMSGPWTEENYRLFLDWYRPDLVALSGWLKPFLGYPAEQVINIHPGPLPLTRGLHGDEVHQKVMAAASRRELSYGMVTMHFVPPFEVLPNGEKNYDTGAIIAQIQVPIQDGDTWEALKARVNAVEHLVQPSITGLVAQGRIRLKTNGRVEYDHPAWRRGEDLPA